MTQVGPEAADWIGGLSEGDSPYGPNFSLSLPMSFSFRRSFILILALVVSPVFSIGGACGLNSGGSIQGEISEIMGKNVTIAHIIDAKVWKSTHPEFEMPTVKAAKSLRFEPAKSDGKPMKVKLRIPIKFKHEV
jgi:hypothetical protein